MNLLTELNREGTTIVMVTHSMHDSEFAHRVINLFDGQVITEEVKEADGGGADLGGRGQRAGSMEKGNRRLERGDLETGRVELLKW